LTEYDQWLHECKRKFLNNKRRKNRCC